VPSLDEVYRKFGEVSEAAQLLETELGNMLFLHSGVAAGLLETTDPGQARELLTFVNRQTLGQLLKSLHRSTDSLVELEALLATALTQRNRLSHSFYREHNFRRNSDEGRAVMLQDLEAVHDAIIEAYKAVMRLSGIDLDNMSDDAPLPSGHLPI
jgi:hypothetical protein